MRFSPPEVESHDDHTNLATDTGAQNRLQEDLSHPQPASEDCEEILDGEPDYYGVNTAESSVYAGDHYNRSR